MGMIGCDVGELAGQAPDVADGRPEAALLIGQLRLQVGDGACERV